MDRINRLFKCMDDWRNFPDYQLERRADIFFSLYLQEVLKETLALEILKHIVPEFPVHQRTTKSKANREKADQGAKEDANRSNKIDYFALSAEGAPKAIFIELKTDLKSLKKDQYSYLGDLGVRGQPRLQGLLTGILDIFAATRSKRKYYCLLTRLEKMGLLTISQQVKARMKHKRTLRGLGKELAGISITPDACRIAECRVIYILPTKTDKTDLEQISFAEFASVVRRHKDPLSQRFARSLITWSKEKAGGGELDMR